MSRAGTTLSYPPDLGPCLPRVLTSLPGFLTVKLSPAKPVLNSVPRGQELSHMEGEWESIT